MSISAFQEKFIRGGCGKFVLAVAGVGLIFGMVFSNCSKVSQLQSTNLQGNPDTTFATYGSVKLPVAMVSAYVDEKMKGVPPGILDIMPDYSMQIVASGIVESISSAQIYELAKKHGYQDDDKGIKSALHISSEQEFRTYARDFYRKAGKLKADSTDKDLDDIVKKDTATKDQAGKTLADGKTISDIYTQESTEVENQLKDGQKRMTVVLKVAQSFLKEKLEVGINPTDDDLKKRFEKITAKRIIIKTDAKVTVDQAKAKADKAYADLKAGKSFEDVMDTYSEDTPAAGKKKKSENTLPLDQSIIDTDPDYAGMKTLQPGAYTEPQKVREGYAIFKYVEKKIDLPKDFETQKPNLRIQVMNEQMGKKFQEAVDALDKEIQPKFEIKSYEALYRFAKTMGKPGPDQAKELQSIYDLAKSVDPSEDRADMATMVEVSAIKALYDLPGTDKAKLRGDRIASFEKFLTHHENWQYRKEVIDFYKEQKNGDKALESIMAAMQANANKFDVGAQRTFSDISAAFLDLKKVVTIKPDQESKFRSLQEQWNIDKKKFDDEQAKMKKQADEDQKKADAAKKAEEAKNGKKPADNKNTGSLAPTTPPKK